MNPHLTDHDRRGQMVACLERLSIILRLLADHGGWLLKALHRVHWIETEKCKESGKTCFRYRAKVRLTEI